MKLIQLTKGKFAIVDDEDFEGLNKFRWYFGGNGYACREVGGRKNRKRVWMHREILGNPIGKQGDHINGNRLNNRKENLRPCSISENRQNRFPRKGTPSGAKGVIWDKSRNKWAVRVISFGKLYDLGRFNVLKDAIVAYNLKAAEVHGEFAKLNLI